MMYTYKGIAYYADETNPKELKRMSLEVLLHIAKSKPANLKQHLIEHINSKKWN